MNKIHTVLMEKLEKAGVLEHWMKQLGYKEITEETKYSFIKLITHGYNYNNWEAVRKAFLK